MAFPLSPLPIKGELFINGSWVNVTSYIRGADEIAIERGSQNEQGSSISTATCAFTLNNRDGRFSNRNPNSPYYGKLGRNVPFRASVTGSTTFAYLDDGPDGTGGSEIRTADKAVLDIVGDIDVRCDFDATDWMAGVTKGYLLAAKYRATASNNRSWYLRTHEAGYLVFVWSSTGASGANIVVTSTVPVTPAQQNGRLAVRATLDVNNGLGGYTVTFYTSDTITGTWTVLGAPIVTTAGTTSIFSSDASLEVGNYDDGLAFPSGALYPFPGKIYGLRVYSGLGTTLVANMDATAQAAGATSWSDGLATPNTWVVDGTTEITADDRRFCGVVSEFPQKWDTTGTDVYVPVVASDDFRRLQQGATPLNSSIYRYLIDDDNSGYWPLEDGSQATSGASTVRGAPPAKINDISFGSDDELPASQSVATFSSSTSFISGTAKVTSNGTDLCFLMCFKYPSVPVSTITLANVYGTGAVRRWQISVNATSFRLAAFDADNVSLDDQGVLYGGTVTPDHWIMLRLQVSVVSGSVVGRLGWCMVNDNSSWFQPLAGTSTVSTSIGRFTGFDVPASSGNNALKVAHIMIGRRNLFASSVDQRAFLFALNAYAGDTAGERFLRICAEEGVVCRIVGHELESETMGPQPIATLVSILEECQAVDGGFLYTSRSLQAITYRTRKALYFQTGPTFDYSANVLSGELVPRDDDLVLRNDVTISRPGGSSARDTRDTGPNNTQDPTVDPKGVGRYATSYSLNTETDGRLPYLAQYATFLGTWDALRYPTVQVQLERAPFVASTSLTASVARLDVGDMFFISTLPAWLPPETVEVMVRGVKETLSNRGWKFVWSTQPYGPFRSVNNLTSSSTTRYRVSTGTRDGAATCFTNASITTTATSFVVKTSAGHATWSTSAAKPGNFPQDIFIGGERMTVGAIGAVSGTSPQLQTFSSVTRSVNGIVKAHDPDEEVQTAEPFYAGL